MHRWITAHADIFKYAAFSAITAVLESIIGILLLRLAGWSEVPANTAGMLIGAAVHYFCVTVHVFAGSVNIRTVFVYLLTFLFGILLQNTVVWAAVRLIGTLLAPEPRYLAAKLLSLAVSFFCTFFIRKLGYAWSSGAQKGNDRS